LRISLTQGAYSTRSIIASAQRCVNLYPESNPSGTILELQAASGASPYATGGSSSVGAPRTYYPAPGLRPLASPPTAGPARGLYWANSGQLFYVCGTSVYIVASNWTMTNIGSIAYRTTPVSMADNGSTLVLVDGTTAGYQVRFGTSTLVPISESTNSPTVSGAVFAFYGADRADVLDGYLLFNQPGTRNFYSTYNNEVVFDALFFAAKNGYSDNLVAVAVTRREIWLIGQRTTEVWYDAGGAAFPFQIIPGPFVQHGCVAKYSIAQVDGSVFFLSQDQAGQNILLRTQGNEVVRTSNHAIETEWSTYATTTDAVGFCFQQNGHPFYQINFPTADKSWRYDQSTDEWHEPVWLDDEGVEHRHRAQVAAFAYGVNVVADWQTGDLYALDPTVYTDAGAPMYWERGWPHLMNDGKRVRYTAFTADMECGDYTGYPWMPRPDAPTGPSDIGDFIIGLSPIGGVAPFIPDQPTAQLSWSDDRGRTFGNPVQQTVGATGKYLTQPKWNRLGMARDRVFKLSGTVPGPMALNGAFIEVQGLAT